MTEKYDLLVVGAGNAGLPLAVEASRLGLRTLLVEKSDRIGGTLWRSWGQLSAGGTKRQAERGIDDNADLHYEDVMRISKNTADPVLVRKAVDLAASTVDWLMDNGFEMHPDAPAVFYFHEAYKIARTYWGVKAGLSVLDVLAPMVDREVTGGNLTLLLETTMTRLVVDGDRVTGVELRAADGTVSVVTATSVALTTGGYAGNPELFPKLTQGAPLVGPGAPASTGDGIVAAEEVGARLRGQDLFLPTYGGVLLPDSDHETVHLDYFPTLTPQSRQPWEIQVNVRGERFVAEDNESVDAREWRLLEQPELKFWVVFDEAIRTQAPPLFPTWDPAELEKAWDEHPSFTRADTLAELAEKAGIDPVGLQATVAAYNEALASGAEDPMGRTHRPAPIATGPFYAVKNHGTVLKTPAGISVNADLKVVRTDGSTFENLYALGEAIGGSTLSGKAFVSGMSVTPSISFGRALAHDLAGVPFNQEPNRVES